jgi:hypothetical protein
MRQYHGLEHFYHESMKANYSMLSEWLLNELQVCEASIYGQAATGDNVILAQLGLQEDGLNYDAFDQRIDLTLTGLIVRSDCVPLTYRVQGRAFGFTGRCSMLAQVCGVDLYLNASYTGMVGDKVHQRFAILLKPLLNNMSSSFN